MIREGFESFRGRRVLLLQGPVGSFFQRLTWALESAGAYVRKVNFNGGDWLFHPGSALNFRGPLASWPKWLESCIKREQIDCILLFGDCRPLHQSARRIALKLNVQVGVFEEGYIRPDFVTLERFGVNGNSKFLADASSNMAATPSQATPPRAVGNTFPSMAWQAFAYGVAHWACWPLYPFYKHHRPIGLLEGARWIRSALRKPLYRWLERDVMATLLERGKPPFYLVPLQVHNDSQVTVHAAFKDITGFIEHVLESFAANAPAGTRIAFKHHPMDRGHTDHRRVIEQASKRLGVEGRTFYIHDQHLPSLLQRAAGVVVINSTVGLSALHHGTPTFACGTALYDLPGLTYQGELDRFWRAAPNNRPAPGMARSFCRLLIDNTQLNGSFYRPLKGPETKAGLVWPKRHARTPQTARAPAYTYVANSEASTSPPAVGAVK